MASSQQKALQPAGVAVVCASNQNRSMAAMKRLIDHGFSSVASYGTGNRVNLPGPTPYEPNIFDFGVPYKEMYDKLKAADENLYIKNGVLNMLERNMRVKTAPERWQDEKSRLFDVVVSYEERVYDAIIEDMEDRGAKTYRALHVLGLDVKDNHTEAEIGAGHTVLLIQSIMDAGEEWEDELENILEQFSRKTGREVMHYTAFY